MLNIHLQNWLESNNIKTDKKVLCAVSGGCDSMVLVHILDHLNMVQGVAHVNYNLRGEESVKDKDLVESFCKQKNLAFHLLDISKEDDSNLQEWAREKRFDFFEKLVHLESYEYVALAHHKEDQLETLLLSFFKGYDLQLTKEIRGKYIRPLLDIDRSEIERYASANKITYREDQSNFSSSYDRNFLRNEIVPALKDRFPNFTKRVLTFAERQKKEHELLDQIIFNKVKQYGQSCSNNIGSYKYKKYSLEIMNEQLGKRVFMKYLQSSYKFSKIQIEDLLNSPKPSAQILTGRHIAQKTESFVFVGEIISEEIEKLITTLPSHTLNLHLTVVQNGQIDQNQMQLKVDLDKLNMPLSLRKSKQGEYFKAFGLKGNKTELSKFLKKLKIPSHFRAQEYLIEDGKGRIIIPRLEIDYDLKIDNETKRAVIIDFKDKSLL